MSLITGSPNTEQAGTTGTSQKTPDDSASASALKATCCKTSHLWQLHTPFPPMVKVMRSYSWKELWRSAVPKSWATDFWAAELRQVPRNSWIAFQAKDIISLFLIVATIFHIYGHNVWIIQFNLALKHNGVHSSFLSETVMENLLILHFLALKAVIS